VVAGVLVGRQIGAALLVWEAINPDKVAQIASVLQETAGGPPGIISGASGMSRAESSMAEFLAAEGKNVEKLAESTVRGVKTADFLVNGVKAELKTLGQSATGGTLKSRIADAVGQGEGNVLSTREAPPVPKWRT